MRADTIGRFCQSPFGVYVPITPLRLSSTASLSSVGIASPLARVQPRQRIESVPEEEEVEEGAIEEQQQSTAPKTADQVNELIKQPLHCV